tara:strand:+ start:135 stop:551 length:417 start_codon:yes stop_codon:yes gene_type:complete
MPNTINTRTTPSGEGDVDLTQKVIIKSEFGRRVWSLMMKKGLNQSDLARQSGLGRDSISQYVRGRNVPNPSSLAALAKALDVDPDVLLPNYQGVAAAREVPTFQIQQVGGDSNQVWLHVNQKVSSDQAMRVMGILNEK